MNNRFFNNFFFFLIYNAISSVIVFQSPFFSPPTRSTRFRKCHIPSIHPTKFNFPRDVSKSLNDNVFGKVTFNGGPLSGNSLPLKKLNCPLKTILLLDEVAFYLVKNIFFISMNNSGNQEAWRREDIVLCK